MYIKNSTATEQEETKYTQDSFDKLAVFLELLQVVPGSHRTVRYVSAFRLCITNNNLMAKMNVDRKRQPTGILTEQVHWLGLKAGMPYAVSGGIFK